MPDAEDQKLSLCIEIISCRGLLAADELGTSDPLVKVKMGDKRLHQTKPVNQNVRERCVSCSKQKEEYGFIFEFFAEI